MKKYKLIYFGFTHCPDICPEELEKITKIVDKIDSTRLYKSYLIPIFVTCDPERDTPEAINEYLSDFSQKIIGLTGSKEEIEKVTKQFRVYNRKSVIGGSDSNDYLIDHSIYIYFVDPDGICIDVFGKNKDAEQCANYVLEHIKNKK